MSSGNTTSQFMDKQVMDSASTPANSNSNDDSKVFVDLVNHPHDEGQDSSNGLGINKQEIVPSYDFQPIRERGLKQSLSFDSSKAPTTSSNLNSGDNGTSSLSSSPLRNYASVDSSEPAKFMLEKNPSVPDATMITEIDRTMKKYADNLLNVLEGVTARLMHLETRTVNLENSIDDLKVSVGNNHGSTEGKITQMENILKEVQSGVQVIKDKQETVEAQLQLAKLQIPKSDQQSESRNTGQLDSIQQVASAPLQSQLQTPPPPVTFPQSVPPIPLPTVPTVPSPTASQQNMPPQALFQNQFPQSQIPSVRQRESYFPPPGQTQDAPNQQYQVPPTQQQQQQPPPTVQQPHQQYQPTQQPPYSQPPAHPPQNYPPTLHQFVPQPSSGSPPSQPYYGTPPSQIYDQPSGRPNSGFPSGYGLPSGPSEPFPYGGPPSQYGSGSTMKPQQHSSAMPPGGGSSYPQLPTARVLPQAVSTASGASGPGSAGMGSRVPIDDVIDQVAGMGFPRDRVRATVQKLTENGQSVDLNMVLDKMMNEGEVQPQRGWFGR